MTEDTTGLTHYQVIQNLMSLANDRLIHGDVDMSSQLRCIASHVEVLRIVFERSQLELAQATRNRDDVHAYELVGEADGAYISRCRRCEMEWASSQAFEWTQPPRYGCEGNPP